MAGTATRIGGARDIVIGVDQGTSNTKALALDAAGRVLAEASRPIPLSSPRPGWVDQDPLAMLANVVACLREVMEKSARTAADVRGLGLANQTETLVVWDPRNGEPVHPAMVWQCRRGADEIESLRDEATVTDLRRRTGLDLDPTFTAAKLKWLFHHRPEIGEGLRRGDYLFGTVDCWLIWKLSGGAVYATDASNASRTMLFDIKLLAWDPALVELFGLSLKHLPLVRPSTGPFGATPATLFGAPIPITGALGDQQASLFGHGCFEESQIKVTYGTGAFLWHNAGPRPDGPQADGLVRTVAWQLQRPCYALEGFVMYAGAALDWLANRLGIPGGGAGVVEAARQAGGSDGAIVIPAFQGLAAPWWEPEVLAALLGLAQSTTPAQICHAGLEAVCYQIRTLIESIEARTGRPISILKVDGGPTRSSYLMQLQADIAQRPLAVAGVESTTPYGAALMAGLGAGMWSSLDPLRQIIPPATTVRPDPSTAARWNEGYRRWFDAAEMLVAHGRRQRAHRASGAGP